MGEECDENLLGHKGPKIGVIENVAFWKKKKKNANLLIKFLKLEKEFQKNIFFLSLWLVVKFIM